MADIDKLIISFISAVMFTVVTVVVLYCSLTIYTFIFETYGLLALCFAIAITTSVIILTGLIYDSLGY